MTEHTATPLRVGVLGGSFDPPHRAHHALAAVAIKALQLDVLHVVPTGNAWHKTRQLTDAHHRMAMTHIAFADVMGAVIDDCEIVRGGASYTADTLDTLEQRYAPLLKPGQAFELVLVIGWDQLLRFTTWHRWQHIASRVLLAVAYRPDGGTSQTPDLSPWQALGMRIELLPMVPVTISSTYVRGHVTDPPPLDDWRQQVSPEVAHYILHNGLYQV